MILFENLNVNLISNSSIRSAVALKKRREEKRREEKGEVVRNKSIDCFSNEFYILIFDRLYMVYIQYVK